MSPPPLRLVFRREAVEHLEELFDYVASASSPRVAGDLVDSIVAFSEDLCSFPLRGRARDDIRPGLRTIGYRRRAVIAFVVRHGDLVVLGVFYGGRDYESLLHEENVDD